MYGDQPFEMFKEYNYPVTNDKFLMTRLSFFISNITLKSSSGNLIVKEIDYLNQTAAHTAPLPANGFVYTVKEMCIRDSCGAPAMLGNTVVWKPAETQIYSAALLSIFPELKSFGAFALEASGTPTPNSIAVKFPVFNPFTVYSKPFAGNGAVCAAVRLR